MNRPLENLNPSKDIQCGEIYGKQSGQKFVMYNVLKVTKNIVILQNIDNPLSQFETTQQKLNSAGYIRISQTPFINTNLPKGKKKVAKKPTRCPYTLDFLEARADSERPTPIIPDLFTISA